MQTHSDDSGNFVLPLVPIGSYDVTAESAGFRTNRVTGVVLRVNDNRRINFTVEVGAVTEQVNVEAELVSVNTASGATSAVLEGRGVLEKHSKGRHVFPFALKRAGGIPTTPAQR